VSRYQKGKTHLDFTGARDSEWQWNPLGHMQVCTSLQADNHDSTPPLSFFTGRMPFLPPNQQCQSTEGTENQVEKKTVKQQINKKDDIDCSKWKKLKHTHPFSGTTQVSQYQNGKTNLDFTEARDSEWQWHQLGHVQVCT